MRFIYASIIILLSSLPAHLWAAESYKLSMLPRYSSEEINRSRITSYNVCYTKLLRSACPQYNSQCRFVFGSYIWRQANWRSDIREANTLRQKMWELTIRIKKNDELGGKRLQNLIMDCLIKAHIEGATVWTGA